MDRQTFRLATVLRLREAARDERRSQFAEALRAEEQLVQQIDRLDAEMQTLRRRAAEEASSGGVNLDKLLDAERYELVLKAERMMTAQRRQQLAEELERRRQALVAADRDVRVLERLRELDDERAREEQAKREMQLFDEVASRRHWQEETQ